MEGTGNVQPSPPPPPKDKAFFFAFTFKICLPHQSVIAFLSGTLHSLLRKILDPPL